MGSRLTVACAALLVLAGVHSATRAQQNPYRLKDPDQTKVCLGCHTDFQDTLRKKSVHTAVKSGDCSGCHDPHVSAHGTLLAGDTQAVCASCHDNVIPARAKSTHKVVADGECGKCHDPHASDTPGNLVAAGSDLCFACHKDLGAAIAKATFKHSPVELGCLTCHGAHSSEVAPALLKTAVPALCVGCHATDTPAFAARHMRYPVGKADCTSCHDPHGSSQSALLLDSVHAPVASRACNQCHEAADSATPLATKRDGFELCRGCHNEMVTATFAKAQLHWPVAARSGCASCHNPHASKHAKLLKADEATLCGTCHADTAKRQAGLAVKHAPVKDGMCSSCHAPHSSSGAYLVDQPSSVDLCTTCHDYSVHSAHPIGKDAVDPRNKNLRVDCLSCHAGHGTPFKHMLLAATNVELCTQCHKQYGR